MRTVGQLLKEERQKKGFTLEQIERSTKIRFKFLTAIDADDYKLLPALPYIQGFIKNYSDFLGLRTTTTLALFRRQFANKEQNRETHVEQPLTEPIWRPTPNKVLFTLILFIVLLLFGYFFIQYQALHSPPPLTIESPKEDLVTKEAVIAVFGVTDHDATITFNKVPILVHEDGKFYKDISLALGSNTLEIISTSRVGEKTTNIRRITRLPLEDAQSN